MSPQDRDLCPAAWPRGVQSATDLRKIPKNADESQLFVLSSQGVRSAASVMVSPLLAIVKMTATSDPRMGIGGPLCNAMLAQEMADLDPVTLVAPGP